MPILMLIIVATLNTVSADPNSIVRFFEERNLIEVQKLHPQSIEALCLEKRNEVALAAAKSLSIDKYIQAVKGDNINRYFTKPPAEDTPEEAECRRQWGINTSAAELLRHLAEKRLINDELLLPYLIEGLDHPDRFSVGQKCFYSLTYLTRHESGDVYWSRLIEDKKKHAEISSWWREWWKKNKDKHPIFDTEVEEQARSEFMRVVKQIEDKVKPHHPELLMFSSPKDLALTWPPLFHLEYNPRSYALVTPPGMSDNNLPWVHIRCVFQSKDLPSSIAWAKKEIPTPPAELEKLKETVYFMVLPGTDILIEVLAASNNEQLIKDLQSALKVRVNTQQDAPADVNKPRG